MNVLPPGHPPFKVGKIGVLLINLGTPEGTSYWPMRRYLKEFLSDRRVIEVNPVLWWVLLNGIILTTRPSKSGHAYEQIWNRELNESPLKTITRSQAEKLAARLESLPQVIVDWGMRYGLPPTKERIEALKDQGCDRILLFPLYPQYSASTTATALDKAYDALKTMRWQPAIRTVPPYFDNPAHIEALAQSLAAHLRTLDWEPDMILASFHGLPKDYFMAGDPYHCQCLKTARLLAERLELPREKLQVAFQSRFGKAEWLQPYAQETVEQLPSRGVKKLLMITPGFASDCVETLEEVAIGLKETFEEAGGEQFSVVPCLNDSEPSITMLERLVRHELQGWI
ncbi:MAG: ferrochelatase [Aestuariivirga sp.]|uniref:ferrochelatase n=1 Tax=Aestuariivirga sp. TaxID=2650926 RepID=UPI0038CF661D